MLDRLHICYVEMGYPHHHGGGGGAGTYVQLVGKALIQRGHRVSVVTTPCTQCPSYAVDEGIEVYRPKLHRSLHWYAGKLPVIRTGSLALRYLEQGWSIARFLNELHQQQAIDLVEFTEGGDGWHAICAPFPYIVHLHGSRYSFLRMSGRPIDHGERLYRWLELAFIGRARCVVSPSQALLGIVASELGQPVRQSAVLPYPLDPRLLDDREASVLGDKKSLTILFAARNDPVKGADILLRAIPLIQRAVSDVEFLFFGYTPQPGFELPGDVRYYPFVDKAELLTHYRHADICVVPSLWDNSPNTVYEAMAAGKAVVASSVGGIPELVADGETGVLVHPSDPQQLAQAIVRLLLSEDVRLAMGRKGRERISALANLDANVTQRLDLYNRVISEWTANTAPRNYAHRTR